MCAAAAAVDEGMAKLKSWYVTNKISSSSSLSLQLLLKLTDWPLLPSDCNFRAFSYSYIKAAHTLQSHNQNHSHSQTYWHACITTYSVTVSNNKWILASPHYKLGERPTTKEVHSRQNIFCSSNPKFKSWGEKTFGSLGSGVQWRQQKL